MKGKKDYKEDYTHPELREKLKEKIKAQDLGGKAGLWSARKAQLLVHEYEKAGGGYRHPEKRTSTQKNLKQWQEENWETLDHQPAHRGKKTARYLPHEVWAQLSDEEKRLANETKLENSSQKVDNPEQVRQALRKAHREHRQ